MTVVLTGGGTGGHIYPALSIGEALENRGASVLFIGNETGLEARLVPDHGVQFAGIAAKGFGRRGMKECVAGTIAVVRGMVDALGHLQRNNVQAIVGTGGYASASVVLAGVLLRIPVVLHEPNAVAGKANRWLSRFASRVVVGFDQSMDHLPAGKCVTTGVAVRIPAVPPDRIQALQQFGLSPDRPTLLVVGGSQGAVALNETVMLALDALESMGFQVLHQTGPKHFEDTSRAAMVTRPWYRALPYIDDIASAYRVADLAVTRAGASTIAEVALYGVPTVFVPFPHAADDHQRANARLYANAGAAVFLDQNDLTRDSFIASVQKLAAPDQRTAMRQRLRVFARPGAADDIARLTMSLAGASPDSIMEEAGATMPF